MSEERGEGAWLRFERENEREKDGRGREDGKE